MAKVNVQVAKEVSQLERARFEIAGLQEVEPQRGDRPAVFEMSVRRLNLDHVVLEEMLLSAGIERHHAMTYVEKFVIDVTIGECARELAECMVRVG